MLLLKKQMKYKYKILLLLSLFCCACEQQQHGITSEVIPLGTGFGYIIRINHKIIIKQMYIPAIKGNTPFCSQEDAQQTADLVSQKIIQKENPAVTLEELKNLQIDFNCLHLL